MNKHSVSVLLVVLIIYVSTQILKCQNTKLQTSFDVKDICVFINKTDYKIKRLYHMLPKSKGDKLLDFMTKYNNAFSELTKYILANNSISYSECEFILKPGGARYFYAPYDDELLKYFFRWTPPYSKNKGKYEEMLDHRVIALDMWNQLHDFLGMNYFDFYTPSWVE